MKEIEISRIIIEQYYNKLLDCLDSDVVIVGAGPAGLTAGCYLAENGVKTTILEKRLSIGGGIWAGAAGYNVITVEDKSILDQMGVSAQQTQDLYTVDAIEFATALAYKAKKAGVAIFNLMEAEDLIIKDGSVKGVVVNNTTLRSSGLLADPFCIAGKYVIDTTGHPAELVNMIKAKQADFHPARLKEGFMDVDKAETGVVEKTGEVYPGLYVAGMSVCAVFGLPRMGPIFGGMLESGKKVAELIIQKI
ncbi:MAG TPA: thiazole biosynthesis protein [Planctomycetes bacterium]|nr:thiazole biosynthesis protein [Planctomycetota bacterium]